MSLEPQSPDLNQTDWVIYVVTERLKRMPLNEGQTWKKRCVYRVPAFDADLNRKAYQPQVVSFGPYHHGKDHLCPMEEHKHRALLHFLERSKKPLKAFLESLREVAQDPEESYDALDPKWKEGSGEGAAGRFLELMFTDGCFMLKILRTVTEVVDDYSPDDPVFSNRGKLYIMQYVRRDMLMLENQLPMLVLDQLVAVESDGEKDIEFINRLILNFCSPGTSITRMGNCLHVLDVFRKSMLMKPTMKVQHELGKVGHDDGEEIIWSVIELDEAGIRFKKSKTDSLEDISFSNGVMRLPVIAVDDTTESMFLNLLVFERFHIWAGSEVTSYLFFMGTIIDDERDVMLLHARGIIQNAIGSDKEVAKLFKSLAKDGVLEQDSSLYDVHKKVSNYCKMPLHKDGVLEQDSSLYDVHKKVSNYCNIFSKCRANLIHIYSSNLYVALSVMAAIFLFVLTTIQTVYSELSYYK